MGKSPDLNFEPLSEGLGFHPFSDGLPYAPISKAATATTKPASDSRAIPAGFSSGSGAVAAGLPTFAPTAPRIQAPRIPVARPFQTQPARAASQPHAQPLGKLQPQLHTQQAKPSAQAIVSQLTPELLQPAHGFGYSLKRVLAYAVDTLVNLSLCGGALSLALWKQDLNPEMLFNPGVTVVAAIFAGFFNWAIVTAEEVAFGTSVGKRLFGLSLQGGASALFLRAFFFLPSLGFGGIGLLWALFDPRRRCWHDLVVDLQPTEIARL